MYLPLNQRNMYKRPNLRGGDGELIFTDIWPADVQPNTVRTLSVSTMMPGESIGRHEHVEEGELYYILEGEATVYDVDREITLRAGDATWTTQAGNYHYIRNDSDKPVKVLFLVLRLPPEVTDPAWLKARLR